MSSCKDPELRRQVREELLYPAYDRQTGELIVYGVWQLDVNRQAQALYRSGLTVYDIATFQGVTVDVVRRRLKEQAA